MAARTSTKKKPSRTARDPTRRRRILEVARRHFVELGFRGTRLEAVAAEAGCAKGSLYLEFPDKEALLREVVDEAFAAVKARFARDVFAIESPRARLRETLRFAYREWAREPLFGRLLREDPELRALLPASGSEQAEAALKQVAMIRSWVDEGIARGEIRADLDRDAVPYVLGSLRLAPQHMHLLTALGTIHGERVLDALVRLFDAGIAATAEDHTPRRVSRTRSPSPSKSPRKKEKKP